ncbi:hypothetical protein KUCAC02_033534 [Chaenocephalus aceratus]|nr:hypothetical protein KUCAC02_033534 [Chaenocephalus aceratus]
MLEPSRDAFRDTCCVQGHVLRSVTRDAFRDNVMRSGTRDRSGTRAAFRDTCCVQGHVLAFRDKEVNLEHVHRRMNSLLDEDLVHKQIPGPSIEISALDIGNMQPSQASLMTSDLALTTFLPGEGGPPLPLPHPHHGVQTQATQRGDFPSESWQDPPQMPISYQGVSAGPIPEVIDATHSTSI